MIAHASSLFLALLAVGPSEDATIVQTGSLSGSVGPPQSQNITIDQFDDLGGALVLDSVVIDQFSSVIGGGTGTGTGVPTTMLAQLSCNIALGATPLTFTQAKILFTFPNTTSQSFTLFDNDSDQETILAPDLAPWTGSGQLTLTAFTEFVINENPANTVFFGAGGGIDWTVTYNYSFAPSVNYCTAGTSASGCQATLSSTGTPSATATSGFSVSASDVEGAKDGLFFFAANGRQSNPWGNGTSLQCVAPPVMRGGLLVGSGTAGACDGSFGQDLNARWTAKPSQNPGAGAVVQAQLWYRDPFNTSNQTTSLSDALEFTVAP